MQSKGFSEWLERIGKEVAHVSELLKQPLNDEPEPLIQDLSAIEAWHGRMTFLLAEANTFVDQIKKLSLPSKEGNTEIDRKLTVDSESAIVVQVRDKLEGLVDAIKTRIMLGQSFLAYQRQFADRGIKA